MEYRTLDINVVSAKALKKVNTFTKMSIYAVISVSCGWTPQRTPVDKSGGRNPTWNHLVKFTLDASAVDQDRLMLIFKLMSKRVLGDLNVGEVCVPVKELLDNKEDDKMKVMNFQVRRPSGKAAGELTISFKFGEKFTVQPPPVAAQGVPVIGYPEELQSQPVGYGYPSNYTPQYQAGYGAPQPGYGYQAAPPGYMQSRTMGPGGSMAMGLGLGMLGGMAGGLLIGDMMSHAGAHDVYYGDGFDGGVFL